MTKKNILEEEEKALKDGEISEEENPFAMLRKLKERSKQPKKTRLKKEKTKVKDID